MGRLASLLRAAAGRASLHDPLGKWRLAVSELLDYEATQVFYPWIRFGATVPTVVEAGPTVGWLFGLTPTDPNTDVCYVEFPIALFDRSQPIVFGVAWAPAASDAAANVSWHVDIGAESTGSVVTTIDATVEALDVPAPTVAATYARTGLVIAPAVFADPAVDELHCKLYRVASSSAPSLPPGLHHIAIIGQEP